jgi:hypothetical protein
MTEAIEARLAKLEIHHSYQVDQIDGLKQEIHGLRAEIKALTALLEQAKGGKWAILALAGVLVFFGASGKALIQSILAK